MSHVLLQQGHGTELPSKQAGMGKESTIYGLLCQRAAGIPFPIAAQSVCLYSVDWRGFNQEPNTLSILRPRRAADFEDLRMPCAHALCAILIAS